MTKRRLIVISDIHLGVGNSLAIFHAEKALCAFLDFYAAQQEDVDLIILGDALDYLQIEPFLCFTEEVAQAKTAAIVKYHQLVFTALNRFIRPQAGYGRKRIIWAIGNHDLELLFHGSRQEIEQVILAGGAPEDALRWALNGERLEYALPGGATVRLVHGNKHDLWNTIDYADVQKVADAGGDKDFRYPHGSVLVASVLNPLKTTGYLHIDLLKPETKVALPLCLALWPDDTIDLLGKALMPSGGWTRDRLKQAFSRQKLVFDASGTQKVPPLPTSGAELVANSLLEAVSLKTDPDLQPDDLAVWLSTKDLNGRVEDFIEGRSVKAFGGDFGKRAFAALLRGAARWMNGISGTFDLERPDENQEAARNSFKEGALLVVAGHSHLARAISYRGGYYLNTGTWADLMRLPSLPSNDYTQYAKELKEIFKTPDQAPEAHRPFRRLTYVDVDLSVQPSGRPFRASLCQWPEEPIMNLCSFP